MVKKEEAEKAASRARAAKVRRDYAAGLISRDDANIALAEEYGFSVVHACEKDDTSGTDLDDVERGRVLYKTGQHNEAVEAFTQAIRKDPSNFAAHTLHGSAYSSMRMYAEALEPTDPRN